MVIGALRLTFIVPPDGKSSSSTARQVKDRLWSKFKIALSELSADSPSHVVIGGALVGVDESQTRDRMDQIIRHLHDWGSVELVSDESEIIHFEDIEMERDFEKYNP